MIERGKTVFRTMFGKLHSLEIGCQRKRIERDFCKTEFSLEFFGDEFLCLFIDEVGNDEKTRQAIRNQQNNEDNLETLAKRFRQNGGMRSTDFPLHSPCDTIVSADNTCPE